MRPEDLTSYGRSMEEILTVLRLGELMMETELTWQATCIYSVLIGLGVVLVARLLVGVSTALAKSVLAWRDAFK